jgi:hypothetical protein
MSSSFELRTSKRNRERRSPIALTGALTALLASGAISCSNPLGPEQSELDHARVRWESRLPVLYEFRFQRGCFCPPEIVRPVRITVSNGVVISAVDPDTNEPVDPPLNGFPTIDDLFDEIQDAIDRDAARIDATYDESFGYPVQVFVDWILNAIDDEMSFQVSDYVEAVPVLGATPAGH